MTNRFGQYVLMAVAVLGFVAGSPARAEIKRFRKVNENLYRGGQPDPTDFVELRDLGIRTVIDLIESPKELIHWEKEIVEGLGMKHLSFPMGAMKFQSQSKLARIMSEILKPENQPVYVHCKEGKDRTGLIVGLYRVHVEGWKPQDAWKEMLQIGFFPGFVPLVYAFWRNAGLPREAAPAIAAALR